MNKIVLILAAVLLAGCNTISDNVTPIEINDFVIVHPDPVPDPKIENIHYEVWNRNRLLSESQRDDNKNKVFYVLTKDELDKLFNNMISVSDSLSKSVLNNQYYMKSIEEYRNKEKK